MPMVPVVPLVIPGTVLPVADETVGIVGSAEIAAELVVGNTLIVGIATAGLTPRLPISVDPSGSPVRAWPPGAVGAVDVGVDDEATLLEPEPHIPEVYSIPEVVDIPDVADIPDDVDMPDDDDDIDMVSELAEVAGGVVPTATPPPS